MYQAIYNSAGIVVMNDIRRFLQDARPSRSKWVSEDRVGQEAMYDAVEKVLNNLKAHTVYIYSLRRIRCHSYGLYRKRKLQTTMTVIS